MSRKKLGIVLKYDDNWIGGLYYKIHLIHAIILANSDIDIIIFTNNGKEEKVRLLLLESGISNLVVKTYDPTLRKGLYTIEKKIRNVIKFSLVGLFDPQVRSLDKVFDFEDLGVLRSVMPTKRVFWIPDIQDIYLPELFSDEELKRRLNRYKYLQKHAKHLVFSSKDSRDAFNSHFLVNPRQKQYVLPFAVFHPTISDEEKVSFCKKYNIERNYFIVSNQFMAHKNHILVLKAVDYLVNTLCHKDIHVIFTGKQLDPRNPDFFNTILTFVNYKNISEYVSFLGLIDRKEQLFLMKNANAVIQPSKYEGWNSTVEDVKLLNTRLICSDIPIHREQLIDYPCSFIGLDNHVECAKAMEMAILNNNEHNNKLKYNYTKNQISFGKKIISIL